MYLAEPQCLVSLILRAVSVSARHQVTWPRRPSQNPLCPLSWTMHSPALTVHLPHVNPITSPARPISAPNALPPRWCRLSGTSTLLVATAPNAFRGAADVLESLRRPCLCAQAGTLPPALMTLDASHFGRNPSRRATQRRSARARARRTLGPSTPSHLDTTNDAWYVGGGLAPR